MAIVRITRGTTGKIFDVWNYDSYTLDLDSPHEVFALPNQAVDQARIIKAQGNLSNVTLTWLMARPAIVDGAKQAAWATTQLQTKHYIDISNGTHVVGDGWAIERQRWYLRTQFERVVITDSSDSMQVLDTYNADGVTPKAPAPLQPADLETGAITKILITRDSQEPTNLRATVSMAIGRPIAGTES